MSAVSGVEFTQRSTLKAGMSPAALAAPAPMATPRNTKGRMALIRFLPAGGPPRIRAHGLLNTGEVFGFIRTVIVGAFSLIAVGLLHSCFIGLGRRGIR